MHKCQINIVSRGTIRNANGIFWNHNWWGRECVKSLPRLLNLVPRAHVPFGQHQDTGLWNTSTISFPEPSCLLLLKFDTAVLSKPNFDFPSFFSVRIEFLCGTHPRRLYLWMPCRPRHACAVKPELLKSWTLEIDYSRSPCLGADQRYVGSGNEIADCLL